jgi:hypothetical protein
MNILQTYIKRYNQIIILILGLPCTNKSEIAKEFGIDLGLKIIKINDYLIDGKFKEIDIDGVKIKLYEDTENYNWDKLNSTINELKTNGVIIYGNYLDIDKIDSYIDFTFFYSTNIKMCKKMIIDKKMIEFNESDSILNTFFDKVFISLYQNIKNKIKINKFFNIKKETTFDESYDEVFDVLMELILTKLK